MSIDPEINRLQAEVERLKERLEDIYLKDTGKTREINILTKENRQLREALEYYAEPDNPHRSDKVAKKALKGGE